MNALRGKTRLVSGGRMQVPADMRRAMGIEDGDTLILELKDGELHVRSFRDVLRKVQDDLRKYVPEGVSIVDELIADRRAEAERE